MKIAKRVLSPAWSTTRSQAGGQRVVAKSRHLRAEVRANRLPRRMSSSSSTPGLAGRGESVAGEGWAMHAAQGAWHATRSRAAPPRPLLSPLNHAHAVPHAAPRRRHPAAVAAAPSSGRSPSASTNTLLFSSSSRQEASTSTRFSSSSSSSVDSGSLKNSKGGCFRGSGFRVPGSCVNQRPRQATVSVSTGFLWLDRCKALKWKGKVQVWWRHCRPCVRPRQPSCC